MIHKALAHTHRTRMPFCNTRPTSKDFMGSLGTQVELMNPNDISPWIVFRGGANFEFMAHTYILKLDQKTFNLGRGCFNLVQVRHESLVTFRIWTLQEGE